MKFGILGAHNENCTKKQGPYWRALAKCGRRGGSNVKATTDKFDSMRTFSEKVVKSPLLLFTESYEYPPITCSSVFLVLAWSIFSVLREFPYMGSVYQDVTLNTVCCYCLSPYYRRKEIIKLGECSSNGISDTCG